MRRVIFSLAVLVMLFANALSPIAAASPSVVTVLSDGTSDSVNLRSEPSMDGSIVGHANPGDTLMLFKETIVTANGWQWWAIDTAPGTVYVRSDLVSAPQAQASPVPQANSAPPNVYPVIDARDLTKAPSRYRGTTFCQMGITFNVLEDGGATIVQMYPVLPYGMTDELYSYPISVIYPGTLPWLYKDMRIVVYGSGDGINTFTNAYGGTVSQPLIRADSIDNISVARYPGGKATFPCVPPQYP